MTFDVVELVALEVVEVVEIVLGGVVLEVVPRIVDTGWGASFERRSFLRNFFLVERDRCVCHSLTASSPDCAAMSTMLSTASVAGAGLGSLLC